MEIHIEVFFEKLVHYHPKIYVNNQEIAVIKAVKLIEKKQTAFDPNILYIGDPCNLPVGLDHLNDTNFLLVSIDPKMPIPLTTNKSLNIISITGTLTDSVFNEILEITSAYQELNHHSSKLFKFLSEGRDLQQLVDTASEMIGNPIFIRDENFKILAFTQNVSLDDYIWNKIVSKGYQTYNDLQFLLKNGFLSSVHNVKVPVYFKHVYNRTEKKENETQQIEIMKSGLKQNMSYIVKPVFFQISKVDIPRIWSNIYINHKNIGHVVVLEAFKPFSERDIALIGRFSDIVSLHLQKHRYYENLSGNKKELLIVDILDETIIDQETVDDRLGVIDWKIPNTMRIITVTTKQGEVSDITFKHFKGFFDNVFDTEACVLYEGKIVVLLNHNKNFNEIQISKLNEILQDTDMLIGMGRSFNDLLNIKKYYKQGLKSIEAGKRVNKEKKLFLYDDYILQHIFHLCSGQEELRELCHPSLFKLIEYDRKRKTDYVKSLYSYIMNIKSQTELAAAMNVHRNTLYYRIGKIEEIMNINLSNIDDVFSIYLSFKIFEYLCEDLS
ncbi:PucR family transcriptional regulator [Robertmurraya korlensis]|uniref:PucR family transcriptional regulator n=1 Tax=Robertmurraya korlensis TaxID=519977 RepID=UPI0008270D77|nr:helix-turn-helix domain-containing protein [Robertmurraya korlensis]